MSYFELKDNDVFVNTIEANPDVRFYIHEGQIFLNNHQAIPGHRSTDPVLGVDEGSISLFEYNIDRPEEERIYPFVTKSGDKQTFKTVSKTEFNTSYGYDGEVINGSYVLGATLTREELLATDAKMRALKSTLKHYEFWSRSFEFSNFSSGATMLNVPSIFYGSSIKKGSVSLKIYSAGELVAEALDQNRRGELTWNNQIVGNVLYNEGIILLNQASWISFAMGLGNSADTSNGIESYSLEFKGVSQLQNMTILAKAPEGMLNHSNNPTYLQRDGDPLLQYHTSSYEYVERQRFVKNIVHSEQTDVPPPFNKETYISKICIYDKHRRLIGVCKLATPIRKTEAREYLFKMKIDL
jgi:hypothetical protein